MSHPCLRNVNFFDGLARDHLGGVQQNGSITNINFFRNITYCSSLKQQPWNYNQVKSHWAFTSLNTDPLKAGDYDIFCPQELEDL